jgi:hypothetical protein
MQDVHVICEQALSSINTGMLRLARLSGILFENNRKGIINPGTSRLNVHCFLSGDEDWWAGQTRRVMKKACR